MKGLFGNSLKQQAQMKKQKISLIAVCSKGINAMGKYMFVLKFRILSLMFFLLCTLTETAYGQTEFEAYKQQINQEFTSYKQQLQDGFKQYKKKTAKVWGNKNSPVSDKKKWVSYQGDLNHRSVVDFEKGTVNVEVAMPSAGSISDDEALRQLKKTIVNTLKQGSDKRSIVDIAKRPVAVPSGKAVLNNQVADDKGNVVNKSGYERLANTLIKKSKKKIIKGADGKSRVVYTAQFRLVPNHIRKRAMIYKDEVNENARRQKIPAALIFAVMETESMFNPTARSHAPAFGLMQLMPSSGALDAYRYLYKEDRVVSDSYLYNPSNNIRLGSAYLNILYYKHFNGIKNTQSRLWASIASYNTGMGGVYDAFAGKYSRSRFGSRAKWKSTAISAINNKSSEEVYRHLRRNLSKAEGREYVKKVREKMSKYQSV